jgi:transcriptional regulator of acetoin/glycerol metabolism
MRRPLPEIALTTGLMTREISYLKKKEEGHLSFDDLIGHDSGLSEQVRTGCKAALSESGAPGSAQNGAASLSLLSADGTTKPIDTIEQEAMLFALRLAGHNITKAARMLGMAKSTFYRKLKS